MHHNITLTVSKWARRHRAFFAVLLSFAVLFNAVQVLAAVGFEHVSQVHVVMVTHAPARTMLSPCCQHHCNSQSCCQAAGYSCVAHSSSLWLSHQFSLLNNNWNKSTLFFMADNVPAPYINTPLLPPPQI